MRGELKEVKFRVSDWGMSSGSFAKFRPTRCRKGETPKIKWSAGWFYVCREEFHRAFTVRCPDILFVHGAGRTRNVTTFIDQVELRLKLKHRTEGGPTQNARVSWFTVAPFWMAQPMRRSLFTILLRAGRSYTMKVRDFEDALYSDGYLRDTQEAVERFLAGYTYYTGRTAGWHRAFGAGEDWWGYRERVTTEGIRRLLISPTRRKA